MSEPLPVATVVPRRRRFWVWAVPLLALGAVIAISTHLLNRRGRSITIAFEEGYGIQPEAALRYRGIAVGRVTRVAVAADLDRVEVTVRLDADAGGLARERSRFWIAHPQADLRGISGLETLFGPVCLEVLPGDGPPRDRFVGVEREPILDHLEPGGLEFVLQAGRRGSLRPGSPLTYRQVTVGRVLSLGLAADGNAVDIRVYVEPRYAPLIREDSVFWNASGIEVDVGLGFTVEADSLESLLIGGVAVATPDPPGPKVVTGHRFPLADEADEDWLAWRPAIDLTADRARGLRLPRPQRTSLEWDEGSLWTSHRQRSGWCLLTAEGILGPADLLAIPAGAHEKTTTLSVGGSAFELTTPARVAAGAARLPLLPKGPRWPRDAIRRPSAPEDCLLVADPVDQPQTLAASRLEPTGTAWRIDPALPIGADRHGAAAVALADGKLIGILLVDDDGARVVPVPPADGG